jgi:iron complex outermembrane receptor protein
VGARLVVRKPGRLKRGEKLVPNPTSRARRALLLAGGCCSSLIMMPPAASAQTAPDQTSPDIQQPPAQQQPTTPGEPNAPQAKKAPEEGAIVVTGIRQSLQNSIQIKRNSASVVEAVSAEEIGKLPDVSIAESIARLPGIAAQRVGGRAEIISIRGLQDARCQYYRDGTRRHG